MERWSFPENETFLKLEFGRTLLPRENQKTQSETSEMFYGKFKGMLPVLGITEKSGPGEPYMHNRTGYVSKVGCEKYEPE